PEAPRWTWRNRLKRETVGAQQYLGAAVRATADRADLLAPSFPSSARERVGIFGAVLSGSMRGSWPMFCFILSWTCPVSLQPVPASCLHLFGRLYHACAAQSLGATGSGSILSFCHHAASSPGR